MSALAYYAYACTCGFRKNYAEERKRWHFRRCPRCRGIMIGVKIKDF